MQTGRHRVVRLGMPLLAIISNLLREEGPLRTLTTKLFYEPPVYVAYSTDGLLHVDTNEDATTASPMSRWKLFRFGLRCVLTSARSRR